MEDILVTTVADTVTEDNTAPVEAHPAYTGAGADNETAAVASTNDTASADDVPSSPATYLPVYNGKICPVQAENREEITTLLQLGMKQREFSPHYDRLRQLARDSGAQSVAAYIDKLCGDAEAQRREQAIATWGEEAGARIYELERAARVVSETQTSQAPDLTAEYARLFEEHPQYRSADDVPDEVFRIAAQEGIALCDAHNRFVLAEAARGAAAMRDADRAASGTTGSLRDTAGEQPPSAVDAFYAGLHSRL